MKRDKELKIEILKDIGDLSSLINRLSEKYPEDPLLKDTQQVFLNLSVHLGRAMDIQVQ